MGIAPIKTIDAAPESQDTFVEQANGKPTTAKVLIDLAVNHCDLFHDERNDGYAVTTHKGIRRTLKLRGKEFRRWLAGTYYATTDKAANNEAISTALGVLEAMATYDGSMLELSNHRTSET